NAAAGMGKPLTGRKRKHMMSRVPAAGPFSGGVAGLASQRTRILARAHAPSAFEEYGWSIVALFFGGLFLLAVPVFGSARSWPQYQRGTVIFFTTIDLLTPACAIAVGVFIQWSTYSRKGRLWSTTGFLIRISAALIFLSALIIIASSWHPV